MSKARPTGRPRIGPGFDSLLTAAQAGAPWALDRIYRALAPMVVGYMRVQGADDPDDLANEVFLGVFTRITTFDGDEDRFRSWVFTIAHSRLVDERRRNDRRPHLVEMADDDGGPVGGNAEDEALERMGTERVRRLCGLLVPDQRDVLLLRLMAGLSIEATAEAMGKSVGAVKALQHRGIKALRKIISRQAVSL